MIYERDFYLNKFNLQNQVEYDHIGNGVSYCYIKNTFNAFYEIGYD